MMLMSGPLWAKKAWGVYWTWDPRLTTLLLSVMIYVAIVVLRAFTGDGDAERKFAAALGVLGTVNLPIIHYSVLKWGGNHPTVIGRGGGGLGHPMMRLTLGVGFLAMTLLAVLLVWLRTRLAVLATRLARLEEHAARPRTRRGRSMTFNDVPGETPATRTPEDRSTQFVPVEGGNEGSSAENSAGRRPIS